MPPNVRTGGNEGDRGGGGGWGLIAGVPRGP